MKLEDTKLNNHVPTPPSLVSGLPFTPGLWVNGKCYWLQNCTEKVLYEEELIVKVKQEQSHSKITYSTIYVSNHGKRTKDVKLLAMYCAPSVGKEHFTFVSPTDSLIYHIKEENVYLLNALYNGEEVKEYTIQPYWNVFSDQIWSSLNTGSLMYQPMLKGMAAIIFASKISLKPRSIETINTWTISGGNKTELLSLNQALHLNKKTY
ncbi:hypothetical protein BTR25_03835 [Bacillus sp. MRMR6]|nr:hypothetical protein BTR25_03835 [Bacillus sp. MRMR6]